MSDATITLTHGKSASTSATVYKFGATVTSWVCDGAENIFVSAKSHLDGSKAIRGGIPVCFPSFGPWSFGPQHGFARSSKNWRQVGDVAVDAATGDAKVVLSLSEDESTLKVWPFKFTFLYTITLAAKELRLDVEVVNTSDKEFDFTMALHTYFSVPDATKAGVSNLTGLMYRDKVDGGKEKKETNEIVAITGFTDRVYQKSPDKSVITGLANGRSIEFRKTNFCDTVVWNPWAENAAKLADFGDEEYKSMICVEAVHNSDSVVLKAGQKFSANHTLAVL